MQSFDRVRREEKNKNAGASNKWERIQLKRLACSLILFFAVFLGKQVYPGRILAAGERIMAVLSENIDLEMVFEDLYASLEKEIAVLNEFSTVVEEVFLIQPATDKEPIQELSAVQPAVPTAYSGMLEDLLKERALYQALQSNTTDVETKNSEPAVGTIMVDRETGDQDYPEGYTADKLSFGGLETVSPILGKLNSGYGYRNHPVKGNYSFHAGADISGNSGDAIHAFADGVVEFVGEDDTYGLYLQLDHGNEIKSFYAHCQTVCVEKGQCVSLGETVAAVGQTGRATGPHLHLELKCCGVHVDPAYYVDFL